MKRYLSIFLLALAFTACDSPVGTGTVADKNRYHISHLMVGLTEEQVINIMGYPFQTEIVHISANESYMVWYYITNKKEMGQQELGPRNFTPFFFQDGVLIGWGYHFYRFREGKNIYDEEKEWMGQRKENIEHESVEEEHRMIPPPPRPVPPTPSSAGPAARTPPRTPVAPTPTPPAATTPATPPPPNPPSTHPIAPRVPNAPKQATPQQKANPPSSVAPKPAQPSAKQSVPWW